MVALRSLSLNDSGLTTIVFAGSYLILHAFFCQAAYFRPAKLIGIFSRSAQLFIPKLLQSSKE